MIGYNRLGSNGRLGNQMFQYAALRGIAANKKMTWKIPPENYNHTANYGLFECFNMTSVNSENIGFVPFSSVSESSHSFDSDLFDNCQDNVNLEGFFQSEKYFKHIEDDIRKDFTFRNEILEPCLEIIDSFEKPPIFLHVRRSDAVGREGYHPIHSLSYYEESLKDFNENCKVFVFSDDIEWCKQQKLFLSDRFLINENIPKYSYKTFDGLGSWQNSLIPYFDLCLMSLCSGAIIANSSLSWWGAWLQNNRGSVVAPMPWFGPLLSHLDTSDIVPDRWIIKKQS